MTTREHVFPMTSTTPVQVLGAGHYRHH